MFPSSVVNADTAPGRSDTDPRAAHDVFENEYVAATADVPSERVNDPPVTRLSPFACTVVTTPLRRPLPSVLHRLAAGSQLQMPTHPREPAVVKAPATMTRSLKSDPVVLRCVMARTEPDSFELAAGVVDQQRLILREDISTYFRCPMRVQSSTLQRRPVLSYRSTQSPHLPQRTTTLDCRH